MRAILICAALIGAVLGAPGVALASASETEAARGAALFKARCATCHSIGEGGGQGPGLGGVVGRKAAGGHGYGYSKALRSTSVTWEKATLDAFLKAPTAFVPGTRMVVPVPAAKDRRELIAYLATLPAVSAGSNQAVANVAAVATVRPWNAIPDSPPLPAEGTVLTGSEALGDWRSDGPGVRRRITLADLPAPFATQSARNSPAIADSPGAAIPLAPKGFRVDRFASDLENPRLLRVAPNGDVFVAESSAGKILVLRAKEGSTSSEETSVFATGLEQPFGIAFYPPGPAPRFVYVANTNSVVRFPYHAGDRLASAPPQTVVPKLTRGGGGHWTRDVAFSKDGSKMFVSVGSASNVAEEMGQLPPSKLEAWTRSHGLGVAWGEEEGRADVRVFDPDGKGGAVFAAGIRNCVGLAIQPGSGDLWCSVNERDGLGDNLVPDYLTSVREGAFYGWPWFYLGDHADPRRVGERPDLANQVTIPDVLVQSHSASLEMTFYEGQMFPEAYRGDAFAAFHGSWNRGARTGYKIARIRFANGRPTGEYEDFLTGFVIDDDRVWGRPVGVAVAKDGSLLVSEDANGTVWRVAVQK